MSEIDGDAAAFPRTGEGTLYAESQAGMSIPTWLAGQALAGMLAANKSSDYAAAEAVRCADETLRALNNELASEAGHQTRKGTDLEP